MKHFDEISKLELRDLLVKNWMTHDAMWFAMSVQYCGMETTNLINKAAVRSMAGIEASRLRKAFGVVEVKSFQDLKTFIEQGFEVIRGPFMSFRLSFPEENVLQWEITNCVTVQGVSGMREGGVVPAR